MLDATFFERNTQQVAQDLLGKVIRHYFNEIHWLAAQIIETEAYCKNDKASHAWLGRTPKREALFMPPGTIYMYYARGKDSLNISCLGDGNAVLIKAAIPYEDDKTCVEAKEVMQQLNPLPGPRPRPYNKLCSGQTLLCSTLGLKVTDWDQQPFDLKRFYIEDTGYRPSHVIQTQRLGIPKHRDSHLPYRFIDAYYVQHCTASP